MLCAVCRIISGEGSVHLGSGLLRWPYRGRGPQQGWALPLFGRLLGRCILLYCRGRSNLPSFVLRVRLGARSLDMSLHRVSWMETRVPGRDVCRCSEGDSPLGGRCLGVSRCGRESGLLSFILPEEPPAGFDARLWGWWCCVRAFGRRRRRCGWFSVRGGLGLRLVAAMC